MNKMATPIFSKITMMTRMELEPEFDLIRFRCSLSCSSAIGDDARGGERVTSLCSGHSSRSTPTFRLSSICTESMDPSLAERLQSLLSWFLNLSLCELCPFRPEHSLAAAPKCCCGKESCGWSLISTLYSSIFSSCSKRLECVGLHWGALSAAQSTGEQSLSGSMGLKSDKAGLPET